MKRTVVALLSTLAAGLAAADGNTLLQECSEILHFAETGYLDETSTGAPFCMGMVNGMMAMNAIYRAQSGNAPLFCPPQTTITNAEGARIVVEYLKANPQQLDKDPGSLMYFAFRDAYPCAQ
ncbi:MAG: Rap1a/Tai family immunity protein [Pseudomonas sp.]